MWVKPDPDGRGQDALNVFDVLEMAEVRSDAGGDRGGSEEHSGLE